jgi:hypothetical protein
LVGIYAQLVGRDLGEGGLVALAVPARTDHDGHVPRGVHPQVGVVQAGGDAHLPESERARSVARSLREAGEAEADQAPLASRLFLALMPRFQVKRLGALLQAFDVGTWVVYDPGRALVGELGDQVAAPDLRRVDPYALCGLLHQALHDEGELPRRTVRHRVGVLGGLLTGHERRVRDLEPAKPFDLRILLDLITGCLRPSGANHV